MASRRFSEHALIKLQDKEGRELGQVGPACTLSGMNVPPHTALDSRIRSQYCGQGILLVNRYVPNGSTGRSVW